MYKAASLPPEMIAPENPSARRVELSRMSRTHLQNDVIYPGDVIQVTIATGLEERAPQSWPLRVSDQGEVNVPLVGRVRVAGLPLTDAEQLIRHESIARRLYRDPMVSVAMEHRKSIRVTVFGAVNEPGSYELPAANGDLMSALVAAGGLTDKASTVVEIRNTGQTSTTQFASQPGVETVAEAGTVRIDLVSASQGMQPDYQVRDGSVIMVREQEPKTVHVIGLVRKPDQYELEPGKEMRLLDALARAGGRTMEIADKVYIIRNLDERQEPVLIAASVRAAKQDGNENLLLAPGDVVSVEETPLTFTLGTLQGFVRMGFSSSIPGL